MGANIFKSSNDDDKIDFSLLGKQKKSNLEKLLEHSTVTKRPHTESDLKPRKEELKQPDQRVQEI